MSEMMMSWFIVGLFVLIFITPAMMAMGIAKLNDSLTVGERVVDCIPIVNIIRAEKIYFGKLWFVFFSTILAIVGIVARVAIWWNFYGNETLAVGSTVFLIASVCLWFLAQMYFVFVVIHDAAVMTGVKLILITVLYPLGQFYVGYFLTNVIQHMQTTEDTFAGIH